MTENPSGVDNAPPQLVLILNLEDKSATTAKTNGDSLRSTGKELWAFAIPEVPDTGEDCWDLFIDTDGSKSSVRAVSPYESSREGLFIGRLNLQQLGFMDKRKRKHGKLAQAYMLKTT